MFTQLISPIRLVLVLALGAALVAAAPAPGDEQDGYVPGEVVVKLIQAADLPALAADHSLDPIPLDQFGSRSIYRLRITDDADPLDRAAALAADARVMYAEPNFLGQTPEGRQRTPWAIGGDSGDYVAQWAPATIRLPEAHTVTRGAGITVAVLDTGVDATHPALAGRLVASFDFVDMDDDPGEVGVHGQDPAYGHGTHVAGVIALTAPEASLMPVRVLDRDGVGNIWVLAEALAFAVDPDGNPATDDGADVINMSLGTTRRTDLLDEIVAEITCADGGDDDDDGDNDDDDDGDDNDCPATGGRGTVVVAAAGNRGTSVREYPAAEETPGLLAVAASTSSDMLALFSTHGPWVQVAGPGEDILSSVPGGGFGTWSGTSMAAPFAAGQAALVRAADPDLTATEVVQLIVATTVGISGPVPLRIDAAAALGVMDTTPPETTIDSGPDATTQSTSPTFTFSADEPGSTFECSLDGAAFAACASPVEYTGLAVGEHVFSVRATDPSGNVDATPASYTWTVEAASDCGGPMTVFADADSWIDQNSAFNNFGSDSILKVRSQGPTDNFRALVRFALPTGVPEGCVVQSATLRLYAASWTMGRTLEAIRVADAWSENAVTWSNRPPTTGDAATTASGLGYREWDVAAQVQAMYDEGSNHGFLVRDATEGGSGSEQQFHSREKGENPPMLVISFAPAGE